MSYSAERLRELLPSVYALRDGEDGPLTELLAVVAEQLGVLEESLAGLYDDHFVETCAPWALPYIGDLLGIEGLPPSPLTPRAEVAHTIAYRRRKGTAAVLEQLARDVTELPARALEMFELLAATQNLNHLRSECTSIASLREPLRLERLGGPFERSAAGNLTHTVDVRRIASGRGRYNIPGVAIFLWRLRALRLSRSPAVADESATLRRFRFSPLGNDAPLFNPPLTEDELTHLAEPRNVPAPISRRAAAAELADFYGDERSILVERADGPVALERLRICDLSDWSAPADRISLDPALGRIVFDSDQAEPPLVSFHLGFAANLGGGEYHRELTADVGEVPVAVEHGPGAIQKAIDELGPDGGVVEIADSGRYEEKDLAIAAAGRRVCVRAAVGARPTVLLDGDLSLSGDEAGSVMLDGLVISGGAVVVAAPGAGTSGLGALELRHATLVPGIGLKGDGSALNPGAPSLTVDSPLTAVTVERSIVGAIRADRDARVRAADSIVDATAASEVAFAASDGDFGATLVLEQATVIGRVKAEALELVSNSLLLAEPAAMADPAWPGPVCARRRQEGCVRFSYLPPGSFVARRHRCQPEREADAARVRPILTSARYGDPGYCQLADATAAAIRSGADDESELGAFHHLQLPRREAHLRARLDEYLRFGLEAGVFHAS